MTRKITKLDLAWEAINSLGGVLYHPDHYDRGFHDAIDRALDKIEALGGRDPAHKQSDLVNNCPQPE